jgi:hypothetical protein
MIPSVGYQRFPVDSGTRLNVPEPQHTNLRA